MFQFPMVFKALYLFCFFAFLRLSNILPRIMVFFVYRLSDFFSTDTFTSITKLSKTLQHRQDTSTLCIPALSDCPLCPFRAVKEMLATIPGSPNDQFFQVSKGSTFVPLMHSVAWKHLQKVIIFVFVLSSLSLYYHLCLLLFNVSFISQIWYYLGLSEWCATSTYHVAWDLDFQLLLAPCICSSTTSFTSGCYIQTTSTNVVCLFGAFTFEIFFYFLASLASLSSLSIGYLSLF